MNPKLKKNLLGEFSVKRMIFSFLLIYGALMGYAWFFTDRQIFQPQPTSYQDSPQILKLSSGKDSQISAVYLPNPTATYTILYSHGNAEDLGDILPVLSQLQNLGFAVFAYDYQGYGTSQGEPSEWNAYRDIDAAYAYLTKELKVASQRIILYGRSVGTGPAVDLATRQPIAGLILESPFLSTFRVVTRIPIVPFDKFNNVAKIRQVKSPILIIHSRRDEVIPFWHGERLFELANPPKRSLWLEQSSHNDLIWTAGEDYSRAIREFVGLLANF